jgi:hypothetical protein
MSPLCSIINRIYVTAQSNAFFFIVIDCAVAYILYILELSFVKNGVEILNFTVGFQENIVLRSSHKIRS